jgi:hypothetical protein
MKPAAGIGGAPRRRENGVGFRPVRHHGRVLPERDARAHGSDRAGARPQVAAAHAIGRRGGEQPLLGANAAQQALVPWTIASMAHQDRHHDLMHREDHRSGGASAAKRIADIDDVADAPTLPAEIGRHRDAHQAFRPQRRNGLARESRLPVDRVRMGRRRLRCGFGGPREVRAGRGERRKRDMSGHWEAIRQDRGCAPRGAVALIGEYIGRNCVKGK